MYFKFSNGAAFLWTLILSCWCISQTHAQQTETILPVKMALIAQPESCVALTHGRKCFTQITLTWTAKNSGNYCLYQRESKKLLQCWKNSAGNRFAYSFESNKKLHFDLVDFDKNPLANTVVNVSWVHKASPRKRRWRLF